MDVSVAGLGPADAEHRGAGTGGGLLVDPADAAADHIVDQRRVAPGAARESLQDEDGEVSRVHAGEPAVALADGGADGLDIDGLAGVAAHRVPPGVGGVSPPSITGDHVVTLLACRLASPLVTTAVETQVLCDVDDVGVATITFNRPEVLNAETPQMGLRYITLLREGDRDPAVRAVVVTGAGRGFCAGADLGFLSSVGSDLSGFQGDPELGPGFELSMSKPLIAAVNGAAAGVGFAHIVMADLHFAAAGAKLTTSFARLGLVAEYGTAWLHPRLVGSANAADLLLSGRTITAEEGLAMGLVQRVLPVEEVPPAAQAWAREVALHCSPTLNGPHQGPAPS